MRALVVARHLECAARSRSPSMKPSRVILSLGLYTLLGFAPLAVNFLVLPVYTARLVPSEFGRLAVVNVAHSFLSLFITVGVDTGYGRLYFDVHKDTAARGQLLVSALAFLAASGALWAVWERQFRKDGVESEPSERWITCDLLRHEGDSGWGYKDLDESMGPFSYSCPLTYLEVDLRGLASQAGYQGRFIDHYLLPLIYPAGLSRDLQLWLAAGVVGVNAVLYAWIVWRHLRARANIAHSAKS